MHTSNRKTRRRSTKPRRKSQSGELRFSPYKLKNVNNKELNVLKKTALDFAQTCQQYNIDELEMVANIKEVDQKCATQVYKSDKPRSIEQFIMIDVLQHRNNIIKKLLKCVDSPTPPFQQSSNINDYENEYKQLLKQLSNIITTKTIDYIQKQTTTFNDYIQTLNDITQEQLNSAKELLSEDDWQSSDDSI